MYDENAGVEVYVRPHDSDTSYREREAPRSSPLYTGFKNERYIEAVNDERFEVVVTLDSAFDFKNYTQASVDLVIDGGSISCYDVLAKPERRAEVSTVFYENLTRANGEWKCVGFFFRELKTVEDHHLTIEEEENEVSKRGKIEVMVQLGRRKRIKSKYSPGHNHVLAQETSKKVAVDRGRSHGISATPVDFELDEEDEHDYKWMPARGIAGTSITFTFFYASRMILELKNIIPTNINSPNKRIESEQTNTNQVAESHKEEQAMRVFQPSIASTGSKCPAKPMKTMSADCDDEEPPPPKKIKTELVEGVASTAPASRTLGTSPAKSSKGKERARLESQLEDIRLQREENRIRRQMMDLDDGE